MNSHIRSMDTLRAVAIMSVVLAHTVLSYGAPSYLAPLQFGGTGVDLFFVLSGWLLGGQLFKELTREGGVNVRRFWYRRWMRTMPAYYSVLLIISVQNFITNPDFQFPWEHIIFVQNYSHPLSFFSVSWSLAVEEQFYLFIAPLIGLFGYVRPGIRTLILTLLFFVPLIVRYFGLYEHINETHARLDFCFLGVLLASIKYQYGGAWKRLCFISPYLAGASLIIYLLSFYMRYNPTSWWGDPDKFLLAIMFGSWVVFANSSRAASKSLHFPGAYYIATRAYSLYLLHPEVLALMRIYGSELGFFEYLLITVVLGFAVSEVLYRLVEKPFMAMRGNFKATA